MKTVTSIKVGYNTIKLAANALPNMGVGLQISNITQYERGPHAEVKMYATTESGTKYSCIVTTKGKKVGFFEINTNDSFVKELNDYLYSRHAESLSTR